MATVALAAATVLAGGDARRGGRGGQRGRLRGGLGSTGPSPPSGSPPTSPSAAATSPLVAAAAPPSSWTVGVTPSPSDCAVGGGTPPGVRPDHPDRPLHGPSARSAPHAPAVRGNAFTLDGVPDRRAQRLQHRSQSPVGRPPRRGPREIEIAGRRRRRRVRRRHPSGADPDHRVRDRRVHRWVRRARRPGHRRLLDRRHRVGGQEPAADGGRAVVDPRRAGDPEPPGAVVGHRQHVGGRAGHRSRHQRRRRRPDLRRRRGSLRPRHHRPGRRHDDRADALP